jgi:transcriptional regulator with XRE-family HTH domain
LDQDLKRIADRIRGWRRDAGLTLQQLGDRSNVSASTIHKIENLQTVPTIAVLLKVANGLSRRPSELLAEADTRDRVALLHEADRPRFAVGELAKLEHLVGMISHNGLDLWRAELQPGIGAGYVGDAWEFQGELVILCERGRLDCEVAGESFTLGPGDTLHLDASQPHRWIAGGDEPAVVTLFALLPELLRSDLMTRLASVAVGGNFQSQETIREQAAPGGGRARGSA